MARKMIEGTVTCPCTVCNKVVKYRAADREMWTTRITKSGMDEATFRAQFKCRVCAKAAKVATSTEPKVEVAAQAVVDIKPVNISKPTRDPATGRFIKVVR